MNVLLDTCALLALARGDLPKDAAAALRSAAEANVSVVSPWEVAIKAAAGKLRLGGPPAQWFSGMVERYDLREVPLRAQWHARPQLCPRSIAILSIAFSWRSLKQTC